jgi:hypothetical protein
MKHLPRALLVVATLTVALAGVFPGAANAARGSQEAPKLLNLWFGWQMPDDKVKELAKWDIVVLDMDQQSRYPERIRQLRALNPKIKILAYVDSVNIAAARFVEESWFPGYKLAHAIPDNWYVTRNGSRASIWPGSWMTNVTNLGPADSQGRRWQDFLPAFIAEHVWSSGLWDGIFLDNALDNATWFAGKGVDVTGDGKADDDATVDRAWKEGWQKMALNLRSRIGSDALIMGNGSVQHAGVTNGILFEDFPRYGWTTGYRDYQTSLGKNRPPAITAFNSNPNNVNNPASWKLMRYTFATAMLGDGYYSYDYGNRDHGQTWWYDEYDAVLGRPTGAAKRLDATGSTPADGVWWRDYERAAVVVNSTGKSATVSLPGVFERIRGSQDPDVNSGRVETSLTLASQDGLVLFRRTTVSGPAPSVTPASPVSTPATPPASSSSNSVATPTASAAKTTGFRNGDLVRVYRPDGTQPRAGFFAQQAGAPGGSSVAVQDVDRDGKLDALVGTNGEIRIAFGNGKKRTLRPFGTAYRGVVSLAAGNTDRDDAWELIAGNDRGDVRVLEQDGVVRTTFRPYGPFRGRVWVAIGDVDGDGLREIVTGAGAGGGPHVRVFLTDGQPRGKGWFAFDARERGGVFVAVGDTDGDGKDDLIIGSGQGTVPRVRMYNGSGELQREFALDSKPGSPGVNVSLSDVDGDGKLEILAAGIRATP